MKRTNSAVLAPWQAAREGWRLATAGYAGEPFLKLLKQQVRWAFAAALKGSDAAGWFDCSADYPLRTYVDLNPRMALKPLRVYLSENWKIERKIKVLRDSYAFIESIGAPLRDALFRPGGVVLATIPLPSIGDAELVLGYDNTYRKEGEMVVTLRSPEPGGNIIALAFAFERGDDGAWLLYVGCIQGRNGVDNKPISKAMHGLFPKAFIVFAIQEIARSLGIGMIFGVGNSIHSHRKKHIIHIKSRHGLTFDYDELWGELGGEPAHEGWFEVPLQLERRPYESIKSNKRSMYTKRYAMLDEVSRQIDTYFLPQG